MEFFEYADVNTTQDEIRDNVSVDNLPFFCEDVEGIDTPEELGWVIYFRHWGRFHLRREEGMGGVRFWVPDCPNALAWTVTTGYPPHPQKIVLHATINRTEHDQEFIEATRELLTALKNGLEKNFKGEPLQATAQPFQMADLRCKL